ncbi:MAG: sulfatase [Lentisphaeria bacterium]|nr:sulfatase [Lentisphaeria bacterium]
MRTDVWRRVLRLAGCVLALSVLGQGRLGAGEPTVRPNVLFIAIDDLNDWVGCLGGHPDVRTPHLDRLAARGVLFSRAYCAAPACNPSRAALMTGILPSTSGVYLNSQPWRKSPVLGDAVTLPQHFRAHGYRAIGSGKIFHGGFPDPASWDEYWPALDRQTPPDPMPSRDRQPLNGIPRTGHFDWGPLEVSDAEMGDSQVADWVTARLGRRHGEPLFLACGFFRPHLPWYVPAKYFDMYPLEAISLPNVKEDDLEDVPEAGRRMAKPEGDHRKVLDHGQWRRAVQAYLASISFVDSCVGRVLDALDAGPNRDNTIVVLWSDHGWHLGEKLHWRKFALWEEATHNVLIIAAPGTGRPGSRCHTPVGLIDIYPTLIELCGLPPREALEGTSLVAQLRDPDAPRERPALTTHGHNNHSLRTSRWRYIRYADGSEELYDHDADDLEWTNLASDPAWAGVKEELARRLPAVNAAPSPGNRE